MENAEKRYGSYNWSADWARGARSSIGGKPVGKREENDHPRKNQSAIAFPKSIYSILGS